MAQSQLDLYNMALGAAGLKYTIGALSDETLPRKACDLWYENVRQVVLRAAHWKCAKRYFRLVEEAERDLTADWVSTDPEPGFAFSYELPADMLYARYLSTFAQFELGYETDQKIISCNIGGSAATDAPVLCYTVDVTDATLWEPDLYRAMILALAAHISMPLNAKPARAKFNIEEANGAMFAARASTANEMFMLMQSRPAALTQRGYDFPVNDAYVYPYGSLFSATGAPPS